MISEKILQVVSLFNTIAMVGSLVALSFDSDKCAAVPEVSLEQFDFASLSAISIVLHMVTLMMNLVAYVMEEEDAKQVNTMYIVSAIMLALTILFNAGHAALTIELMLTDTGKECQTEQPYVSKWLIIEAPLKLVLMVVMLCDALRQRIKIKSD